MRKKIVAGNWKMNKSFSEAVSLATTISKELSHKIVPAHFEAVLIPPFPFLRTVSEITFPVAHLNTGAQNCSSEKAGAFTGEVSAEMIASCGASYVIIGHSERRTLFAENGEVLQKKIDLAIDSGLTVIACVGESLKERKGGSYSEVIYKQVQEIVTTVSIEKISHLVIAYEPVWAIGTGETATPDQAVEVHNAIRQQLTEQYMEHAFQVPILYGGSCNASNAESLFSMPDIDGGLIGGASLKAQDFVAIFDSLK